MSNVRKRIAFFFLVVSIAIGPVSCKEVSPHTSDAEKPDLLATLQNLHSSLSNQIENLKKRMSPSLSSNEKSELTRLVEHYTAQRNNIDHEISHIQSNNAEEPRHFRKPYKSEEKTYSSVFTLFRRTKNDTNEMVPSENLAYALPYPPYYFPGYGIPYPYSYYPQHPLPPPPPPGPPGPPGPQRPPTLPNNLIQNTFPGFTTPPSTFVNREQFPQDFQRQPTEPPNINVPLQFSPTSQVMLQPDVQSPQPQQQIKPQFHVDPIYHHQPVPQREQNLEISDQGHQHPQQIQSPQGQNHQNHQGVLIYYPDGIAPTNDIVDDERPSIADRVNQAFDRFGQVISNLTSRQTTKKPGDGEDRKNEKDEENQPAKNKLRQRVSDLGRGKVRWVSV